MFPTTVTLLSLAMIPPGRSAGRRSSEQAAFVGLVLGKSDVLVTDDIVRESEEAIDLVEVRGRRGDLQHGVDALELLVERVCVPTLSPEVGGGHGAATLLDQLGDTGQHRLDTGIVD